MAKSKGNRGNLWGAFILFLILCPASVYGAQWVGNSIEDDTVTTVDMTMIERVRAVLDDLDVTIVSADAFEVSNRIVIQYTMDDDELWMAEQNLKDIVCAVQGVDTESYGLRIGGNMTNGLTGLTATIEPETLAGIDCSLDVIDWSVVADEWSVTSGLE